LPFSELNTQPAYAPVQRFKCSLTTALAWLGVRMVATPFLYDSFIHYSTPVYPDAIQPGLAAPQSVYGFFRAIHVVMQR